MRRVLLGVLSVLAGPCLGQTRVENITPLSTDPAITGWLGAHGTAYNAGVVHRNQLFVFLHGQGGSGTGALELLRTAAEEGYHAVALTYPNDWQPFNLCQGSGDPDCALKIRREIVDGVDRTALVSVSRADSVENRAIKLLQRLEVLHPGEGWAGFLEDGQLKWDMIVVWGHSQGGGNAGVIAKDHELARCCTSAPAADGGQGNPAAWWAVHATPAERYYGFCHTQDQLSQKVAFWNGLGMGAFGGVVDVAGSSAPFSNTHELSTSVEPAIAGQYHNSPVMDAVTPRMAGNVPRYKEVWRYMLTAGAAPPPPPTSWDDVVFATVPTSTGTTQLMMDIHGPLTPSLQPSPVLVWIHGGGWQSGSHNQTPSFALALRERGITVASIGYRLSNQAVFPAQLHDCKGAIRFLRANASVYHIDPDRIAVWGSSAGAHLAALVATCGNAPALEGDTGGHEEFSSAVLAAADFYGPTDLLNMQPDCLLQPVGCSSNHDAPESAESRLLGIGNPGQGVGWLRANLSNPAAPFPSLAALAHDSNPVAHVDPADPPMYIAHGDIDTVVPINASQRLVSALTSAGVVHQFHVVPGFGHGSLGTTASGAAADWIAMMLLRTCSADFNRDGDVGTDADIEAFFACLAGNCCATCGSADFNGDGDIGTDGDIEAFFRVLGGGAC